MPWSDKLFAGAANAKAGRRKKTFERRIFGNYNVGRIVYVAEFDDGV